MSTPSYGRGRERAGLAAHLRFSFAAAMTGWAAMWTWRGFTEVSVSYLYALLLIGAVIAGVGAFARWRRLPGVVVVLAQVVTAGAATCAYVADRPYPGERFWDELSKAVDAANTYASPVPATDTISVQPLLVVGGVVAMLLVDLFAGTLRRVPLAGLPLLTVYSVPVSLLGSGLSWYIFAATAFGFLLMLYLQEEEHLTRWGRSLEGNGEPVGRLSASVRGSAIAVASLATGAAVVLPLAIPTFSFSVFDGGPGSGGDGDIEITNPILDLRRDLLRGENVELVRFRTDDPDPDHLRISVLNRFTAREWSAGDRQIPTSNLAQGTLPPLDGVDPDVAELTGTYDYDLEIAERLRSRWLPTQAPISSIDADGDWRFDDSTMDFFSSDEDVTTSGLSYSFQASDLTYDADRLLELNTRGSLVEEELTELPDDFPSSVRSLAQTVTAGSASDFETAVVLQRWFRHDGGFEYSTKRVPTEVGQDELVTFLSEDPGGRVGYCEQFAAAMATMARSLDIPARVAVGFLKPTEVGPGEWVYMSHDLHAWVELYFPGAGWILFDPTPTLVGDGFLPDYSTVPVDTDTETDPSTPTTSREPTTRPPLTDPAGPTTAPDVNDTQDDGADAGSGFPWLTVLATLGSVILVVLLALLPRQLRRRQRGRRVAGVPEQAWDELRAHVVDLHLTWPEGRSPRETAAILSRWFGRPDTGEQRPARGPDLAPEAVSALDRIVDQVERSRYARSHTAAAGTLADDVSTCADALTAGVAPRTRRRAAWWPRSVFQRRPAPDPTAAPEPELVGGRVVEHI